MYRCVCFFRLCGVLLLFAFLRFFCRLVSFFLFFVLFLFESSMHPSSVFVFSFSVHSFRSFLLLSLVFDRYVPSTSVTLCCCFLFSCLCQCVIVLFYEGGYIITDNPFNTQNATTDISAVELSVSVKQFLANEV